MCELEIRAKHGIGSAPRQTRQGHRYARTTAPDKSTKSFSVGAASDEDDGTPEASDFN